jgi:hypothetical protein
MRLYPQPSVVFDWKHFRVMSINPQPSVVWLETLTCNETKCSAFRGLWLETLAEGWGFNLITCKCFQSQTTEGWGFNLITCKCFESQTTEGWRFSLITRKCLQSQSTEGWGFSLITNMCFQSQTTEGCDWKHLRVMRLNFQPSVVWLETLTCNETKSSAFRGLWRETLTCNETKSSAFHGLWLETLTCNETEFHRRLRI